MKFKTGECSEEERNNFYPTTLYCERCGKDTTTITHFNEVLKTVRYECICGNQNELSVLNTNNMKLNWKIDWPMRWMIEDVVLSRAEEIIHQKRVVIMYQKKLREKYSIVKRLIILLTILLELKGIMKNV